MAQNTNEQVNARIIPVIATVKIYYEKCIGINIWEWQVAEVYLNGFERRILGQT